MAITFPGSPSIGQLVTQNSRTYQWTGKTWDLYGNVGAHKSTHATGGSDALAPSDIGASPSDSPSFTGNVGIGTASPGSRLDVIASGGQGINSINTGSTGSVTYALSAQATGAALVNTAVYVNSSNATTNYGVRIVTPTVAANSWAIYSDATAQSYFAGSIGVGVTSPTLSSGIGIHCGGSTFRLATSRTPASSTATGNAGEICWDASYLYVCVNTNTWRRVAHSTW
jgi:hypothetical protein